MILTLDRAQAKSNNLDDLLEVAHEGVSQLMEAQNFYVALCDEERENFRFAYFRDNVDTTEYAKKGWMPLVGSRKSFTTKVITTGNALILTEADFLAREREHGSSADYGPNPIHWMGMPLLRDDGLAIGAVVVQSYDPQRTYSAEDQALFQMAANFVATFVSRVQKMTWLTQAVKTRTQSLEAEINVRRRSETLQRALYEISSLSGEDSDTSFGNDDYAKLHEIIGRLMPAKNFFVGFHEPETDELSFAYYVDETEPNNTRREVPMKLGDAITSLVIRSGNSVFLDRSKFYELVAAGKMSPLSKVAQFVWWIGAPLNLQGKTIGALVLQSYDDTVTYTESDLELLNYVARHIVGTLAKLRARDALLKAQQELVQRNTALSEAVDHLKSAQGELVRQERLASLGALVAGIAHEINTPLGVCVTATSHLEEELLHFQELQSKADKGQDAVLDLIDAAEGAVRILKANTQRAAGLIHSFKQISVDQSSGELRRVALAAYLGEVLVTLGPSLKNKPYKIHIDCAKDIFLHTHPGALAQVVTNLIMNSLIHGFDGKSEGNIHIVARQDDASILLEYRDDGHGMSSETLKKLFDPFFTTKRGSGGSGLGAHIVHNLVTGPLGGRIEASSEVGCGLTYKLVLPAEPPKCARPGAQDDDDTAP